MKSIGLRATFLLLLFAAFAGCRAYQEVTKQLPTFANLQNASFSIQKLVEEKGSVTDSEAFEVIGQYFPYGDDWGNEILYLSRPGPPFSFLLISTGRDGQVDLEEAERYFDYPQEDIVGKLDRDIVFRDGQPVTIASSK